MYVKTFQNSEIFSPQGSWGEHSVKISPVAMYLSIMIFLGDAEHLEYWKDKREF